MTIRLLLSIAAPLAVAVYLLLFNPGSVTFRLSASWAEELPIVVLVLASATVGAFAAVVLGWWHSGFLVWRHRRFRRMEGRKARARECALQAVRIRAQGNLGKARRLARRAVRMDPELSSAALLAGDLAAEAGDYSDAIERHRSAWNLSPHSPEVAVRLSSDLLSAGRIDEAEKLLLRASELEGGHPVILRRLRDLYADSRRWEEARMMAEKLSRLNATPSERKEDKRKENRLLLVAAEAKLADSDGKGAAAMFEDAARRLPGEEGPRLRLGDAYLAENRGKRAVKTWEAGYRDLGKHDFLRRLVFYYKQHGKGNLQAATAIVSVGRARPSDPVPAVMAAALYFEEGQAEEAIQILRSASASTGSIGDVDAVWFDLVRNLLEARGKLEEGDRLAAENDFLRVAREAGRKVLGDSPEGVVFAPLNGSAGSENRLDG